MSEDSFPMNILLDENFEQRAMMKVVGVGGAGGNAINTMVEAQLKGVDFIAINTDAQALEQNKAARRIQIGKRLTHGLGAGANPEIGRRAIEEDKTDVEEALADASSSYRSGDCQNQWCLNSRYCY